MFNEIKKELDSSLDYRIERVKNDVKTWHHIDKPMGFSFEAIQLFYQMLGVAVVGLTDRDEEKISCFNRALIFGIYGAQINFLETEKELQAIGNFQFDHPDLRDLIMLHGLSAKVGLNHIADWLSPFLLRSLQSDVASEALLEIDKNFTTFAKRLFEIENQGKWSLPKKLGETIFSALLKNAENIDSFKEVLYDYCDFRWANAFGWAGVDANKKRNPDSYFDSSIFSEISWDTLIPYELFSMQYIFNKVTGENLSLRLNHPLLGDHLDLIPSDIDLTYSDEWVDMLRKFVIKEYKDNWLSIDLINN